MHAVTADLIEVFKILRGFENLDPDRFFQVVGDGARRGHSFKLFKKRYRLDVGKFKFASRVCEEWNTGWGWNCLCMQGQWMFVRQGLIITWGTWGGIYLSVCFFPLPMAIQGRIQEFIFGGPNQGPWSKVKGEARIEGAKRPSRLRAECSNAECSNDWVGPNARQFEAECSNQQLGSNARIMITIFWTEYSNRLLCFINKN